MIKYIFTGYFFKNFSALADSSGATMVLPSVSPSIPSGPVEPKQLPSRVEELEIWKRPSRASEIMRFGYPGFDNLRTYEVGRRFDKMID